MTELHDDLLAGPRGRRLCLELLAGNREQPSRLRSALFAARFGGSVGGTAAVAYLASPEEGDTGASPPTSRPVPTPEELSLIVAATPLPTLDEASLFDALLASVDSARYWQEPEEDDRLAAHPEVRRALAPIARVVADSPAAGWWTSEVDLDSQWATDIVDDPFPAPTEVTATDALSQWRSATMSDEETARHDRPSDPRANMSGNWTSTPPHALTQTTRELPERGAVGAHLVEDSLGYELRPRRVAVPADSVVYEITGAEAWAELCRRYPLEVTASRRHDWWRTTGIDTRWLIPDFSLMAREFDGVHLTVAGYLSAAGRAIEVTEDAATVLGGWNPDQSYWLSDAASVAGWTAHR